MLSFFLLLTIVLVPLLLLLPIFALGFATALLRNKAKVAIGYGDDPSALFARVGRAHGNATEYNPSLAMLVVAAGLTVGIASPGAYLTIAILFLVAAKLALLARYASVATLGISLRPTTPVVRGLRMFSAFGTLVSALMLMGLVLAGLVSVFLQAAVAL